MHQVLSTKESGFAICFWSWNLKQSISVANKYVRFWQSLLKMFEPRRGQEIICHVSNGFKWLQTSHGPKAFQLVWPTLLNIGRVGHFRFFVLLSSWRLTSMSQTGLLFMLGWKSMCWYNQLFWIQVCRNIWWFPLFTRSFLPLVACSEMVWLSHCWKR